MANRSYVLYSAPFVNVRAHNPPFPLLRKKEVAIRAGGGGLVRSSFLFVGRTLPASLLGEVLALKHCVSLRPLEQAGAGIGWLVYLAFGQAGGAMVRTNLTGARPAAQTSPSCLITMRYL
jgi:hypothetical protein